MSKPQRAYQVPTIYQFEQQFSQLSLINCKEKHSNPKICKGMFSQINPKKFCSNTKLENQNIDVMQCKTRCLLNQGTSLELDLDIFKFNPCTNKQSHNHKQCCYYHDATDRRRRGNCYDLVLCPYIDQKKTCPYGNNCGHSHNLVEQYYQPEIYKTQFCPCPTQCHYGLYCPFAHSEAECKTKLIENFTKDYDFYMFYYKVYPCPHCMIDHDQENCVYFHDSKDKRRCLMKYHYNAMMCPSSQCQDCNCPYAHNQYELYYHPQMYMIHQCPYKQCDCPHCPCYHNKQERRVLTPLVQNGIFKIVCKNRSMEYGIRGKQSNLVLPKIH